MTLQEAIRGYLEEHDLSQRALSLNSGLNAKAVSDILNIPGLRPRHSTLLKLSQETGLDLVWLADFAARTFADLLRDIEKRQSEEQGASVAERQIKRLKWLIRQTGWVPQTRIVCRAEILDFFARITPAEANLTKGSLATYKSDILGALDATGCRARPRSVTDVGGVWAELRDAIRDSDLTQDQKRAAGPILVYLADRELLPSKVTREVLLDYYRHRLSISAKSEAVCRKHVKRVAKLFDAIARDPDFARFGCHPVSHPFPDGREKFGVPDSEIAAVLEDWDRRVVPWARGELSRDGQIKDEFIAALDNQSEELTETQLRRRARRARKGKTTVTGKSRQEDLLKRHGFLTESQTWSEKTIRNRRGYVVALAKAYVAATEEHLESIDELADPEALEEAIDSLCAVNSESDFDSEYAAGILKTMRKLAIGLCQRDEAEIEKIGKLIEAHETGRRGIAQRNKAKLRQFTEDRIQKMIDLSDLLIVDINSKVAERRKSYRSKHGTLPNAAEVYDQELLRDVMITIAHAIMMKRGPRSANLIGIRLDWIRWRDGLATIVVPASQVKMRKQGDAALPIPLGASVSKLLRTYLDTLREKALLPGDETNPFLFPGQDRRNFLPNRPYSGILQRLTRTVHRIVGVKINPHLYRHLIGWIWLKEDLDNLPKVQKLLGHKSLQTTIDYYAEVDEELALDQWQRWMDQRRRKA